MSFYQSRVSTPFVDVKGLAEREVEADLASWDIRFVVGSNELSVLQQRIERQTNVVVQFLHKEGLNEDEIIRQIPSIYDRGAERYSDIGEGKAGYSANLRITVLSSNIPLIKSVVPKATVLVDQGIALKNDEYKGNVEFRFTKLNEIKPQMIKEATLDARKAAGQFAEDSGNKVGNICHAMQGRFSIEDTPRQHIKNVRVVTEVRYFLSK